MKAKQTLSERFKDRFQKGTTVSPDGNGYAEGYTKDFIDFFNTELTSLAQEILSKKKDMTLSWGTENQETIDFVPVSDILAILEERGIELEK